MAEMVCSIMITVLFYSYKMTTVLQGAHQWWILFKCKKYINHSIICKQLSVVNAHKRVCSIIVFTLVSNILRICIRKLYLFVHIKSVTPENCIKWVLNHVNDWWTFLLMIIQNIYNSTTTEIAVNNRKQNQKICTVKDF